MWLEEEEGKKEERRSRILEEEDKGNGEKKEEGTGAGAGETFIYTRQWNVRMKATSELRPPKSVPRTLLHINEAHK